MPYVPRTRQQIRDSWLADWQTRYAALNPPQTLLTIPGSDAYMLTDSGALELEVQENQALTLTKEILPDQADPDYVARHGAVDGVTQKAAIPWTGKVQISGTALAVVTFGTATLVNQVTSNQYGSFADPVSGASIPSVTLDGAGHATAQCTCLSSGLATTLADGTILQWSSTPANANSTATVITGGTVIQGADVETFSSWANRIIARRQARPASGNRSDWQNWALQVNGIANAWVHPEMNPSGTTGILGTVTVVIVGPVSLDASGNQNGDNVTNARFFGGGSGATTAVANVGGFIEGTRNAAGVVLATNAQGTQLRPVTIPSGNYTIVVPTQIVQNLEMIVTVSTLYPYPWTYNAAYLTLGGGDAPSSTTFKITGNLTAVLSSSVAGNNGVAPFFPILVKFPNFARGNYVQITPTAVQYDGAAKTLVTFAALSGAPVPTTGAVIAPAPPNWQAIRLAVFAYFDSLGPGDANTPSSRWPTQDTGFRATLYRAALAGALIPQISGASITGAPVSGNPLVGVAGVLSASITTPGTDVTPTQLQLLDVGDLLIHA